MKKKRFLTSMILTAVSIGGLVSGANGAVISVNYETVVSSTPAMAADDEAGVIPVDNWNNVVNRNHAITFVDNLGATTGLAISVSGGGQDSWNRGPSDPLNGRIFSDKITMGGIGTINLTTVPYALYDVYVYLSDWSNEVVSFSLDDGTTTVATLANTIDGFNGSYIVNDTYVKLSGLSGPGQSIRMAATSGEVHVGAFQVVQIPEPGAALLGGLGMLALLRRRRG